MLVWFYSNLFYSLLSLTEIFIREHNIDLKLKINSECEAFGSKMYSRPKWNI